MYTYTHNVRNVPEVADLERDRRAVGDRDRDLDARDAGTHHNNSLIRIKQIYLKYHRYAVKTTPI